jgi:hypothetical protein
MIRDCSTTVAPGKICSNHFVTTSIARNETLAMMMMMMMMKLFLHHQYLHGRHQFYLRDLGILFEVVNYRLMIVLFLPLIQKLSEKYNIVHVIQRNLVLDLAILFQMR